VVKVVEGQFQYTGRQEIYDSVEKRTKGNHDGILAYGYRIRETLLALSS
jgi:hypothetical protein